MTTALQPAFSYRHTSILMAAPAQSLLWRSDTDWNAVHRHCTRCFWIVPPSRGLTLLTGIRWTKGACYTRRVQPVDVSGPKWPSKNYLGPHTWSRGLWPIHIWSSLSCIGPHFQLAWLDTPGRGSEIEVVPPLGGWAGRCEDLLFPAHVHGLEWEGSERFAWNEKGPGILNRCFPSLMTSSVLRSPDQDPCCSFVGVSHQGDSRTS